MSDTPQVLLQHHLKKLRLPTFHGEYDKLGLMTHANVRRVSLPGMPMLSSRRQECKA